MTQYHGKRSAPGGWSGTGRQLAMACRRTVALSTPFPGYRTNTSVPSGRRIVEPRSDGGAAIEVHPGVSPVRAVYAVELPTARWKGGRSVQRSGRERSPQKWVLVPLKAPRRREGRRIAFSWHGPRGPHGHARRPGRAARFLGVEPDVGSLKDPDKARWKRPGSVISISGTKSWLPTAVFTRIVNYERFQHGPVDWEEILWSQAPWIGLASNPDMSTLHSFWPVLAVAVVIFAYTSVLPALLCRQLWRLGYRRPAWITGLAVAIATVFVIG